MSDYETDFAHWADAQALLLRRLAAGERVNGEIDWPNVIEEIESLAKRDRREIKSRIHVIIRHLAKLEASPARDPRQGWKDSIKEARLEIERVLDDNASMRNEIDGFIAEEHVKAVRRALEDLANYGEAPRMAPGHLTYDEDSVLGDWFPEDPT